MENCLDVDSTPNMTSRVSDLYKLKSASKFPQPEIRYAIEYVSTVDPRFSDKVGQRKGLSINNIQFFWTFFDPSTHYLQFSFILKCTLKLFKVKKSLVDKQKQSCIF